MTAPELQLPFPRPDAVAISPVYTTLRRESPIARVRTPAGDVAWLVTGYEQARTLFADPRLGRSHPEPEKAARVSDAAIVSGPTGSYDGEQAAHERLRRLLVPAFSAGRMRRMADHVQELVDGCLDALQAARDAAPDSPVDLHEHLSFPLPVRVICGLLGVPVADAEYFHGLSDRMSRFGTGGDADNAMREFHRYMHGLVEQKRSEPGEDVVTDMVRAQEQDPTFDERDMIRLAVGLLFAGHETTVARLDLGVVLLTGDEARRDAFAADPDGQAPRTVEEILRLASPGGLGLLRYAREDVEIDGTTIARGDAVVIATGAANRDETAFEEPEEFDPQRSPNPHVAFGHGGYFCIGASLARTEMRIALASLFTRFPTLRLAVPVDALEAREDRVTGGLAAVPVVW